MTLIRLPLRFVIDHEERALPTPVLHRVTKRHCFVAADDPHLGELLDDARHYAHANGPDQCPLGIIASAKAIVKILEARQ